MKTTAEITRELLNSVHIVVEIGDEVRTGTALNTSIAWVYEIAEQAKEYFHETAADDFTPASREHFMQYLVMLKESGRLPVVVYERRTDFVQDGAYIFDMVEDFDGPETPDDDTKSANVGRDVSNVYDTIKTHTDSRGRSYRVMEGKNGYSFVNPADVTPIFHATDGNEKTGKAGNYNLPVEMTCDHRCECYRTGDCYACGHCYSFPSNQADYAENLNFYRMSDDETFIQTVMYFIRKDKLNLYRWFTCGDIPDSRFLRCMVEIARRCPDVEFWAYTKKYSIVNAYLDTVSGVLPENLCIIFSHWMNHDGSYFPMNNPYILPTSEFIPIGREDIESGITHVCPCSDPGSIATCETCDRPCYRLKRGESMGLREHSTKASKARDDSLKASKNAIKATKKAEKRGEKKAK